MLIFILYLYYIFIILIFIYYLYLYYTCIYIILIFILYLYLYYTHIYIIHVFIFILYFLDYNYIYIILVFILYLYYTDIFIILVFILYSYYNYIYIIHVFILYLSCIYIILILILYLYYTYIYIILVFILYLYLYLYSTLTRRINTPVCPSGGRSSERRSQDPEEVQEAVPRLVQKDTPALPLQTLEPTRGRHPHQGACPLDQQGVLQSWKTWRKSWIFKMVISRTGKENPQSFVKVLEVCYINKCIDAEY